MTDNKEQETIKALTGEPIVYSPSITTGGDLPTDAALEKEIIAFTCGDNEYTTKDVIEIVKHFLSKHSSTQGEQREESKKKKAERVDHYLRYNAKDVVDKNIIKRMVYDSLTEERLNEIISVIYSFPERPAFGWGS